jgi:hypothetical protein
MTGLSHVENFHHTLSRPDMTCTQHETHMVFPLFIVTRSYDSATDHGASWNRRDCTATIYCFSLTLFGTFQRSKFKLSSFKL